MINLVKIVVYSTEFLEAPVDMADPAAVVKAKQMYTACMDTGTENSPHLNLNNSVFLSNLQL